MLVRHRTGQDQPAASLVPGCAEVFRMNIGLMLHIKRYLYSSRCNSHNERQCRICGETMTVSQDLDGIR